MMVLMSRDAWMSEDGRVPLTGIISSSGRVAPQEEPMTRGEPQRVTHLVRALHFAAPGLIDMWCDRRYTMRLTVEYGRLAAVEDLCAPCRWRWAEAALPDAVIEQMQSDQLRVAADVLQERGIALDPGTLAALIASPRPAAQTWPPLDAGTRVLTRLDRTTRNWSPEALAARRDGVRGTILSHHDSHGLCYDVAHDAMVGHAGSVGCYEPQELEVLP